MKKFFIRISDTSITGYTDALFRLFEAAKIGNDYNNEDTIMPIAKLLQMPAVDVTVCTTI